MNLHKLFNDYTEHHDTELQIPLSILPAPQSCVVTQGVQLISSVKLMTNHANNMRNARFQRGLVFLHTFEVQVRKASEIAVCMFRIVFSIQSRFSVCNKSTGLWYSTLTISQIGGRFQSSDFFDSTVVLTTFCIESFVQ